MLRRAPRRRAARTLLRRPWHPSTEDVLTTAAAAVLGGAVAVPLVGWDTHASPAEWLVLVALATGLGAAVAGLRSLWSDERVAARAARAATRRQVRLVAVPTCSRWRRRTERPSCRQTHGRQGQPCLHPRTLARHSGREGLPASAVRAHRPHV